MESDILCQPYYEVYNEDTLRRCISFLIEKEKEGLFLIRAMIDETCHQGRVTLCNRKREN